MIEIDKLEDKKIYYLVSLRITNTTFSIETKGKVERVMFKRNIDPASSGWRLGSIIRLDKSGREVKLYGYQKRYYKFFNEEEEAKDYYNSVIMNTLDRLEQFYQTTKENLGKLKYKQDRNDKS